MKLLIIGGAGHVGTILRESLESRHDCTHLDRRPVAGTRGRMIVGDVHDDETVAEAVAGQDALLYLAMGSVANDNKSVHQIDPAFAVNVRDLYRALRLGLEAGVRRIVYASTLSVFFRPRQRPSVDESLPPDAWEPYGLSKRMGEHVCAAAAQHAPGASVLALRLNRPTNEANWPALRFDPANPQNSLALGPQDLRRLFCAAVEFHRPGFHVAHASGDMTGETFPTRRAEELLGWSPRNE